MHRKKRFGRKQLCSVLLAVSLITVSVMPAFAAEAVLPETEGIETSISDGQAESENLSGEEAVAAAINEENSENDDTTETEPEGEQSSEVSAQTDGIQTRDISGGQDPAAENDDADIDETEAMNTDGAADGMDGTDRNETGTEGAEGSSAGPEGAERGTLSIIHQPEDASAFAGDTVSFHVEANESDVTYQWQWSRNETSWTNCTSSGSNTDTFTFKMREALAGRYYRCVVNSASEAVESNTAQVTLAVSTLEITSQPVDVSAYSGDAVSFHVEANESNVTYQWQWSSNGTSWLNCTSSGYDTDTFAFKMREALAGRYYRCVVSTANEEAESSAARATLAEPTLEITAQPVDMSAYAGEMVSFHVEANESDVAFQWQWSSNGTSWLNCTSSGYDTDTFTFKMREALAGRYYRCVVSTANEEAESAAAQVTLAEPTLAFTVQPQDVNAEDGEPVSLHVEVNESDVTYQWQWSSNGTSWLNCTSPGYDTDTFTFSMREALSGRYYRCEVRSANETIASNAAMISLAGQELSITLQPENLDVHLGDSVTLYAEASESDVYYQWQWSKDGTSWTWLTNPVYKRDTYSFTVGGTWVECYYRCYAITPDSSVMVVSNTAKITKKPLTPSTITITSQPQDVTVLYGNDTTLRVEAVSTNSDEELRYIWERSFDGGNTWSSWNWSQECDVDYVNNDGDKYRCLIVCGNDFVYSNIVTISLSKTPVIICNPFDIHVTPDTIDSWGDLYFNMDAYGDDLEYQWQVSTDDGSTWNDCEGENEIIIYIEDPEAAAGNLYRCTAANSYGTVTSDAARMDYYEGFYIGTHPQDVTATIGEEVTFRIEVVEENPDAEMQYSWMYQEYDEEHDEYHIVDINDNESAWTDTLTLTATSEFNGKYFACAVYHDLYGYIRSNPAKLTVLSNLEIETQPKDFYILPGDTTWPVFYISVNGVNVTYQWQVSEDGGETWADCANEGGIVYEEEPVCLVIDDPISAEGKLYRCVVSDGLQTLISDSVEIVNYSGFYFISQPEDQDAEVGQEITFSAEAIDEDPSAEITYQWYYGADEESLSPIEGANGTTLTITAMPENHCHYYACKAETYHGTITTNLAMLRVDPPLIPIIYQQPEDVHVQSGQLAEFWVCDYAINSTYYDWQMSSDNGATWSQCRVRNDYSDPYISENCLLISDPEDWNGYLFRCTVSNEYGSVTSEAARLTVYYNGVTITQQPEDVVSEPGQDFQFSIVATDDDPEAELTYQWYSSPRYLEDDLRHIYNWEPVDGATSPTLSKGSDDVAIYNGNSCIYNGMYYKCEVTSSVHGVAYSEPASYWFAPISTDTLQITRHPTGVELTAGTSDGVSATFVVAAEGDEEAGEIHYQWEYSNDNGNTWTTLEGKTSPILIVSDQEEWAWRSYRCVVSNDVDILTSHVAKMLPVYIVNVN